MSRYSHKSIAILLLASVLPITFSLTACQQETASPTPSQSDEDIPIIQEISIEEKIIFISEESRGDEAVAEITGEIAFDTSGCMVARPAGSNDEVLIIWPKRAKISTTEASLVLDDGKISLGSTISEGGGFLNTAELPLKTKCDTAEAFVVN